MSLDISPIETLWSKLEDIVAKRYPETISHHDLFNIVFECWAATLMLPLLLPLPRELTGFILTGEGKLDNSLGRFSAISSVLIKGYPSLA